MSMIRDQIRWLFTADKHDIRPINSVVMMVLLFGIAIHAGNDGDWTEAGAWAMAAIFLGFSEAWRWLVIDYSDLTKGQSELVQQQHYLIGELLSDKNKPE